MTSSADLGIPNLTDVQLLGRGGFSMVYSAVDAQFARRVAVKVLTRVSSDADRRRFERECEIMGRLSSHANVVTVYSAGFTSSGDPYLVMELVDGGSLADQLKRSGPLPWRQAVSYIVPVARALAEVHRNNILHRDLKPDNILLAGDQPRLTDFGISSLRDFVGPTSTHIAASLGHAPPETYSNHRDERSDIYSLASTLYELVSGSAPIVQRPDEPIQSYIHRTLNEPPAALGSAVVPPAVDALLQRCLAKDPDHRCQTADQFATELEAAASSGAASTAGLPAPPTRAVAPMAPGGASQPVPTGSQPYAPPQPTPLVGAGSGYPGPNTTGGNITGGTTTGGTPMSNYGAPPPPGGYSPPPDPYGRPDSTDLTQVAQPPYQPPYQPPGYPQQGGYQQPQQQPPQQQPPQQTWQQPQQTYQPVPTYQPSGYEPQGFTPSGNQSSKSNRGLLIGVLAGLGALLLLLVVVVALKAGGTDDVTDSTSTTATADGSSSTASTTGTGTVSTATASTATTATTTAGSQQVDAFAVVVGDCLASGVDGSVQSVNTIGCDQPHQSEVYYAFDVPEGDGTFPGTESVQSQGDDGCLAVFQDFVGLDYDSSKFYISTLVPTENSWNQLGDREVLCLLGQEDGTLTTGSAQGTGI